MKNLLADNGYSLQLLTHGDWTVLGHLLENEVLFLEISRENEDWPCHTALVAGRQCGKRH